LLGQQRRLFERGLKDTEQVARTLVINLDEGIEAQQLRPIGMKQFIQQLGAERKATKQMRTCNGQGKIRAWKGLQRGKRRSQYCRLIFSWEDNSNADKQKLIIKPPPTFPRKKKNSLRLPASCNPAILRA
jgi:hypothetical protein